MKRLSSLVLLVTALSPVQAWAAPPCAPTPVLTPCEGVLLSVNDANAGAECIDTKLPLCESRVRVLRAELAAEKEKALIASRGAEDRMALVSAALEKSETDRAELQRKLDNQIHPAIYAGGGVLMGIAVMVVVVVAVN